MTGMNAHQTLHGWRISGRCGTDNCVNNCVEVSEAGPLVGFRDTKESFLPDSIRPALVLSSTGASAFMSYLKTGQADLSV